MQKPMPQSSDGLPKEADKRDKMQIRALKELFILMTSWGWMFELVDGQDFREFRNPTASVLFSYLKFSESSDAKISFYGRVDFENEGTEGWRFLEKELLLPSSIDDERDMKRTQEFLNIFTPIAINVEGDYAFLLTDKSGQIFESVSPDLEEVSLVATSLSQLVIRLQTETKILPLSLFVRTWLGKHITPPAR